MQQHYCQTSFTCRHAIELQVWWLLVFPCSFSHDWSDPRVFVQRIAAELWTHWSVFLLWTPERDSHLEFWTPNSDGHKSTTASFSLIVCFRLCVHTLRFETATWNSTSSPTCDLCEADDDVKEKHVIFLCIGIEHLWHSFIHLFDHISRWYQRFCFST